MKYTIIFSILCTASQLALYTLPGDYSIGTNKQLEFSDAAIKLKMRGITLLSCLKETQYPENHVCQRLRTAYDEKNPFESSKAIHALYDRIKIMEMVNAGRQEYDIKYIDKKYKASYTGEQISNSFMIFFENDLITPDTEHLQSQKTILSLRDDHFLLREMESKFNKCMQSIGKTPHTHYFSASQVQLKPGEHPFPDKLTVWNNESANEVEDNRLNTKECAKFKNFFHTFAKPAIHAKLHRKFQKKHGESNIW